jgi:hypothetical protein
MTVEIVPEKQESTAISAPILSKRARALFGACAEVQLPDYGKVLWAHCSRNDSRKAL